MKKANYKHLKSLIIIAVLLISVSLSACSIGRMLTPPKQEDKALTSPEENVDATPADEEKLFSYDTAMEVNNAPTQFGAAQPPQAPGSEPSPDGIDWNTEEYDRTPENPFYLASQNPLSTFAADVDTASYANIRRFLQDGLMPNKDAVRIEEMINYFSYDYPAPKNDEPFSVNLEIVPNPWNEETELLRLGLQAPAPKETTSAPSNLVFLIDVSGSMHGADRLDLIKRAYLSLLDNLGSQDRISIVTYAGTDQVLIEGADLDQRDKIMTAIENLQAGGGTHGSAGIITAYEIAEKYFLEEGNNRIILATDGDLNIGITSEGDLEDLVSEKKESGVFLSVLGFGRGNLGDSRLETLANKGNGEYYYIDSLHEARRVLVDELGSTLYTVAKDVKFQIDFNPFYIKGYRLIGYENRVMNHEDFADDTKDGGEIGAGHNVTVLFEIVRPESKFELKEVKSKYQDKEPVKGKENGEMLTVNIRYKEPDADTSTELNYPIKEQKAKALDNNTLLASSIAEFGLLLKDSEFKGDANYDNIIERLQTLKSEDSYVIELLSLVQTAKKLCAKE